MSTPDHLHVSDPRTGSDAPSVVLVHGAMDRSASFGRMARHLEGIAVVRYDRRGYGRSASVGIGTFDDHVADLLAVIGARPAIVFGHSIGGVVALAAALERPEAIAAVVAYEHPAPWEPWWPRASTPPPEDPADEAEAFMRRAIGDRIWSRLPERIRQDRRGEGLALRADIASIGRAPYVPGDLPVPVLAACGSETTWWHERATTELADRAFDGELVVVEGSQHGVHLTHPKAAAGLVLRSAARAGLIAPTSQ